MEIRQQAIRPRMVGGGGLALPEGGRTGVDARGPEAGHQVVGTEALELGADGPLRGRRRDDREPRGIPQGRTSSTILEGAAEEEAAAATDEQAMAAVEVGSMGHAAPLSLLARRPSDPCFAFNFSRVFRPRCRRWTRSRASR